MALSEVLFKNLSEELRKITKILSDRAEYAVGVGTYKVTNME
jgi:chorismate mutase